MDNVPTSDLEMHWQVCGRMLVYSKSFEGTNTKYSLRRVGLDTI